MTTLRFDYKINNFRDIHFNYNIGVNITPYGKYLIQFMSDLKVKECMKYEN